MVHAANTPAIRKSRLFIGLATVVLSVIAVVCAVIVIGIMVKGGRWEFGLSARNPYPRIGIGLAAVFLLYVIRRGVHNTARDWLRFCGRVVLFAIGSGISLCCAEIAVRLLLTQQQEANSIEMLERHESGERIPVRGTHPLIVVIQVSDNPVLIYELQPDLDTDFGEKTLRTNRYGMRDSKDYVPEKAPGTVRIVGIGDSGMFGWGLNQDEDYLSVLESNLNARAGGAPVEVLNMAVPGYNAVQEVEMLLSEGLQFQPDVVIVGWCENDYGLPFCAPQLLNVWRTDRMFLPYFLFDRDGLRRLCGEQVTDFRDYEQDRFPPEILRSCGPEGVKRVLARLDNSAKKHGFQVLMVGPMRSGIAGICAGHGIRYLNTREEIQGDRYPREYGVHRMHPGRGGHRVIAEHLEERLDSLGWLDPGAES